MLSNSVCNHSCDLNNWDSGYAVVRLSGCPILLNTCMITDRIELSPLPLFINIIYIFALFDFRDPFLKSPDYFLGLKSCFMFVVFQFKIKVSIILKMKLSKKLSVNEAKLTGL